MSVLISSCKAPKCDYLKGFQRDYFLYPLYRSNSGTGITYFRVLLLRTSSISIHQSIFVLNSLNKDTQREELCLFCCSYLSMIMNPWWNEKICWTIVIGNQKRTHFEISCTATVEWLLIAVAFNRFNYSSSNVCASQECNADQFWHTHPVVH